MIEALCILAAFPLGWVTMLIAGCYLTFLQGDVIGLILAPRIFSKAVGVHPIVAFFALFAGENSLDSSEGCFQSLLPMCSSRSSWLSGTGGNRSIPINSRQKRCLLNNKQKFHASPNTFLHTLRLCCECTGGFYSRGDSVPFVITCQALSCTQVVGADAHPGPWVRFPG